MLRLEVLKDVELCEGILASEDIEKAKKYVGIITASYGDYIEGIQAGLDIYSKHYNNRRIEYLGDIEILKRKLELFQSNRCSPTKNHGNKLEISNINTNDNSNTNNINIQMEFKEAREKIENNESLTTEDIIEVLAKIDEIEQINNSKESRNQKWFKLRPTMEWVGTKGIVVASAVLNLITAILKLKSK